jgi:hypothetical protein
MLIHLSRVNAAAAALLVAALSVGCAAHDDGYPAGPIEGDGLASNLNVTKDLISPATCALISGRLRNCLFSTTRWTPPALPSAVPLRTTVTAQVSGNCSTPYPLEVTFRAPGLPDTPMQFLSNRSLRLRLPSGGSFTDLTVLDLSSWTGIASFDQTCRVSLQLAFNDLDVDTDNDAVAIIARL